MKLFGDSKKSKHAGGASAGAGRAKQKKKMSGKKKALLIVGIVAGVLAALALAALLYFKIAVKPPEYTNPGLNLPSRVTEATEPHEPGGTDPAASGSTVPPTAATEPPDVIRNDGIYTVVIAARDIAGANTDAIMVAKFDTNNYTLNVVSIPRDTLVNVSYRSKLVNAMYAYGGIDGFMEGITDLIGFRPDDYVVIKLRAIEKIVDAVGGVDYYVPQNMNYDDDAQNLHIHFTKGMTHMTGAKAVEYMRYRKGYADADIGRINAQHEFLAAMVSQVLAKKDQIPVTDIVDVFFNDLTTDLTTGQCVWFAKELLKMNAEDVHFDTMPGNYNDYYKGRSYVTVTLDEWIEMINAMINPYNVSVTAENLDVLTRNASGKMVSTTGIFADPSFANGSSSKPSTSTTNPPATEPQPTPPPETQPQETDPTVPADPTGTDPTVTDPTGTDPGEIVPSRPPETDPGTSDPSEPPETEPDPSTQPPETDPTETTPPETQPPETTPPETETPETQAPEETTPPETEPPTTPAETTPAETIGESENT